MLVLKVMALWVLMELSSGDAHDRARVILRDAPILQIEPILTNTTQASVDLLNSGRPTFTSHRNCALLPWWKQLPLQKDLSSDTAPLCKSAFHPKQKTVSSAREDYSGSYPRQSAIITCLLATSATQYGEQGKKNRIERTKNIIRRAHASRQVRGAWLYVPMHISSNDSK